MPRSRTFATIITVALLVRTSSASQQEAPPNLESQVRTQVISLMREDSELQLTARVMGVGDPDAVMSVLLEILQRNKLATPGTLEYGELCGSIIVLGNLKERRALPILLKLALPEVRSKDNEYLRSVVVKMLGMIDPVASRDTLVTVLKTDEQWYLRTQAADILSQIPDPQVLQELDVAASKESGSPNERRMIQEDADALRTRLAGATNKPK